MLDSPRAAASTPAKGRQSAAGQPAPEDLAAAGNPAADRAERTAKLRRGLLVREALPVAEQDDRPIFLRQPPHLFLDDWTEECLVQLIGRTRLVNDSAASRIAPASFRRRLAASTCALAETRAATP